MKDCIFCKIVKKEIPCAQVFESENFVCFLDIAPASAGHTLVVPKTHYPTIWELPIHLGNELLDIIKKVSEAILKATNASGLNILMNNNPSAGQVVPHAHIHLIPRHENDEVLKLEQKEYENKEMINILAEKIKSCI